MMIYNYHINNTKNYLEDKLSNEPYNYRESIIVNLGLKKCDPSSAYRITAYSCFKNFKENELLGETHEDLPNNYGELFFNLKIMIKLYFERCQFILLKIYKKSNNKAYTVKVPIKIILRNKNNTYSITYEKDSGETVIINHKIYQKHSMRIELGLALIMEQPDYKSNFCYFIKRDQGKESDKIRDMLSVYRSENQKFQKNRDEIDFNLLGLTGYEMCLGDLDSEIIFFIFNDSEKKILVDTLRTSINKLLAEPKIKYDDNITLLFNIKLKKEFSFVEYLKKGLEINMSLAIDFTSSNGNPNNAGSLHALDLYVDNPYEKAIKYCGEIIAQYDTDKIFPCFGYGAILPNQKEVSHCFSLNLSDDPNISEIKNVLECYNEVLKKITLKDPTYFSFIIKKMIEMAKGTVKIKNSLYNILIIMTDGKVDDFNETVNAIVEASSYPISIIIVGIGTNKFENMDKLDKQYLTLVNSKGQKAVRDIVKFIPYIKYENNIELLAEEIFSEIPHQVVEYFSIKEISPSDFEENVNKN